MISISEMVSYKGCLYLLMMFFLYVVISNVLRVIGRINLLIVLIKRRIFIGFLIKINDRVEIIINLIII